MVAGSFIQGKGGASDLGQDEGMILIGRKDGEMEWQGGFQEVRSWSIDRRWNDGVVRMVTGPLGGGVHR